MDKYRIIAEQVSAYVRNTAWLPESFKSEENKGNLNHIIQIATSIKLQQFGIQNGGGFVNAVLENNLGRAIEYADTEIYQCLKTMIQVRDWCQITGITNEQSE